MKHTGTIILVTALVLLAAAPAMAAPAHPAGRVLAATSAADTVYIVQRGDTLFSIALRFKTTVAAIKAANNIVNVNLIYVGQRLIIPGGGSSSGTGSASGSPSTTTYVVQRGDNLYRISLRFGVTVAALKAANGLRSDLIYVGQRLVIPGASGAAPASAPAASSNPTATKVPATAAAPTATKVPTATPVPAATAVPQQSSYNSRGIVSTYFWVENPKVSVNQDIWFNWNFTNTADAPIFFSVLAPHADGGPSAQSWTNYTLGPHQSIEWRDHMNIGQAGTYQIYVGVCYDGIYGCLANQVSWERLSNNVAVTVQ